MNLTGRKLTFADLGRRADPPPPSRQAESKPESKPPPSPSKTIKDPQVPSRSVTLEEIAALAPALFDPADPKPLAIRIHRPIAQALGTSRKRVKQALQPWCTSWPYMAALMRPGAGRWSLNGSIAAPVCAAHADIAALILLEAYSGGLTPPRDA